MRHVGMQRAPLLRIETYESSLSSLIFFYDHEFMSVDQNQPVPGKEREKPEQNGKTTFENKFRSNLSKASLLCILDSLQSQLPLRVAFLLVHESD
eukprot:6468147-Amphidinium_carterae.1